MICAHCNAPVSAGKRRYCSERCKRAAYIERYEARHGEHPRQRFVRLYREQTGESYDAVTQRDRKAQR